MLYDSDFDSDALEGRAFLFWGVPGPRTGTAVVIASRPREMLSWLTDRATVEGPASPLARSLPALRARIVAEGTDDELAVDALAGALEDAGVAVFALGPLERELRTNEAVRARVWTDVGDDEEVAPEAVWRGGEAHSETAGHGDERADPDPEPERGYRLDAEVEEWAEHEESLSLEREALREFVAQRLEVLRTARPERRVA